MSILGCVFALIMVCFSANCKHKNVFLQRTSTKTILTKKENFRELQVLEWTEKCTFWKRKKRNGEKRAKRFFRAIFLHVKICKTLFLYYKNQRKSGRLRHFTNVHFFRAVYICNVHFRGWVSDVLERSRA